MAIGVGDGGAHTGAQKSTVPLYGGTTAVSAMSNAALAAYYFSDVTQGQGRVNGTHFPQDGLKYLLASGRYLNEWQDFEDAVFIRQTLGLGNGD